LSSIDPHEFDEALVSLLAEPAVRSHVHLPIQSGDDRILRAMRRGHRAADFEHLVQRLVDRVPDVAIGTDVITGFPGEDDAAFENTRALLQRLPLAYLHVFSYSPRRGTAAAEMDDPVTSATKAERTAILRALSDAHAARFARSLCGRQVEAVVHRGRDSQGRLVAMSEHLVKYRLEGPDALAGRAVRLRVDDDHPHQVRLVHG
jgi:threonylcarbamoyladenosine tRNA methylthiotransferase MtaB